MIDGQDIFDQPVINNLITNDNIKKLQQVEEMIIQLVVCNTVIILKNFVR